MKSMLLESKNNLFRLQSVTYCIKLKHSIKLQKRRSIEIIFVRKKILKKISDTCVLSFKHPTFIYKLIYRRKLLKLTHERSIVYIFSTFAKRNFFSNK